MTYGPTSTTGSCFFDDDDDVFSRQGARTCRRCSPVCEWICSVVYVVVLVMFVLVFR